MYVRSDLAYGTTNKRHYNSYQRIIIYFELLDTLLLDTLVLALQYIGLVGIQAVLIMTARLARPVPITYLRPRKG